MLITHKNEWNGNGKDDFWSSWRHSKLQFVLLSVCKLLKTKSRLLTIWLAVILIKQFSTMFASLLIICLINIIKKASLSPSYFVLLSQTRINKILPGAESLISMLESLIPSKEAIVFTDNLKNQVGDGQCAILTL